MKTQNLIFRAFCFYRDGFRSMTVGRSLWVLILIKLFIMFVILKIFFFPNHLGDYEGDERGDRVRDELIERNAFRQQSLYYNKTLNPDAYAACYC